MPAVYAHYRFGSQMLSTMPGDIRRSVKRFRRLYDVGLHGPDLFFYYRPMLTTRIQKLGARFPEQTGPEFFSRVCRNLRLEPSEAANAYLYGVLCHYSLDSACHPLVMEQCQEDNLEHTRIETAFDRFLMIRDGKASPERESLTQHLALTESECREAARFYPGAEAIHIRRSLKSMVQIRKLLSARDSMTGQLLRNTVGSASTEFAAMEMCPGEDNPWDTFAPQLLERYQQAALRFPELLLQLSAHLTYNAPLGEGFSPTFG